MSTVKFTPGEWHIWEDSLGFPFIFDEDGKAIASMCGKVKNVKKPICHIEDFVFPERVLANASLIAAAPEMYKFIAWLGSVEGQCAILTKDPEIVRKAHAILKKARGEE